MELNFNITPVPPAMADGQGEKMVRIILGHLSVAITEVNTELDQQKAIEAIVRVGAAGQIISLTHSSAKSSACFNIFSVASNSISGG